MTEEPIVFFEIFPWTSNFETGIELIDDQHKKLVDILNQLAAHLANRCDEIKLNEIFDELADYANYHFQSEEKIWSEYFHEDEWYINHEHTHGSFIDEIVALRNNTNSIPLDDVVYDVVTFLSKWLAYHILDTDKRMALAVKNIQSGYALQEAKADASEKMAGFMQVVIETVLTMYESLSMRTLDLMREKALRIQTQEALMRSEERWRFILEGGSDNVWDWDIKQNTIIQSKNELSLFETISNHQKSTGEESKIHPSDALEVNADFQAHLDGATDFYINKHRVLQKNGKWSWILTRGKVVSRDSEGKPLRMIGTHSDITEKELASLIHTNSTQAIFICDADRLIVSINPAFTKITGYSEEESIGKNPKFIASGQHNKRFYEQMWEMLNSVGSWSGKIINKRKNGEMFSEFVYIKAVIDGHDKVDHYIAMFNDITEEEQYKEKQKEQKQELEDQKELYELVFKNTVSSVLIIDIERNRFIDCNESAIKILQCDSKEEVLNLRPADLSPEFQPDGRRSDEKSDEMNAIAVEKGSHIFEWVHLTKTNEEFWVEVILTPIVLEGKKVLHVVWKDIGDRKKAEEQLYEQKNILHHQAYHDALTNLPNRALFNDRVNQAIEKAKRYSKELAIFFIDLDHFKHINDSLGHGIGDKVLQEIANRLNHNIRKEDTLARFGGDEFVLLVDDLAQGQDATPLAQKILESLSQPLLIEGHTLYISSSIGISLFPQDDQDVQKLLMYADNAMYRAKDAGRNNFQFYSAEMTELAFERVTLETSLRQALENNEFIVYYQPQINGSSGQLIGMEALVRWNHPIMGLVSPAKFIPLAEETGLIVPLDQWVMKTAMMQIQSWYAKGLNPGILALNLAIKQLQHKDCMTVLEAICNQAHFKPQWLELEVTESQIMTNPEEAIVVLKAISEKGVLIAIDDFGTGYSSLSYLKRLPINKLKIDKSFVDGLPDNEEDAGIAKAVIALAKSLKLSIIAEGVETKEQKDFLIQNGCDNIQGYFYGKPMSALEMEKTFLTHR
ncbi:MAG: bacteriohemerythrin [Epsilonproteobacteria bacterium]|nr:bacteriohemerythrin [Campylobacterota bacterium]